MLSNAILITGAARRLGRAVALDLARHGWDVAVHYRRSRMEAETLVAEIVSLGRRAVAIDHDLEADAAGAGTLVERATQALGGLHALVLNASLFEKDALQTLEAGRLRRHFAVHLESALWLVRAFEACYTPGTGRHGQGAIVALTDSTREWSMSARYLSYALSKRSLEEAVRLLAPTLAPAIRINALALGPTMPGEDETEAQFQARLARLPLRRSSTPDLVGEAVRFLLETPSISGQVVNVGGEA